MLIDTSKITSDTELIKSKMELFKKCNCKHRSGCLADTCEECLAAMFSEYNRHLLEPLQPDK